MTTPPRSPEGPMSAPESGPDSRQQLARAARDAVSREVFTVARDVGAKIITRRASRGAGVDARDSEPITGLRVARHLELASQAAARDYIQAAREAGHSWHAIGVALGLDRVRDPGTDSQPTDELAYTYAAGEPDPDWPWRSRSYVWRCPGCDQAISDAGPCNGPADDQRHHAADCARLAAEAAAWDAQWEAGQ